MTTLNIATAPHKNVTVSASAGTGKTYLLVHRILRLLIEGTETGEILAITFTRKAASEMKERLTELLYELSCLAPNTLTTKLIEMGVIVNDEVLQRSQTLYEKALRTAQNVRITTFHAFCQDVLEQFPVEANIPASFDIVETTQTLSQQAWEELMNHALSEPNSPSAKAIDSLFNHYGTLYTSKEVLDEFLNHRSDWWAFTEASGNPINQAEEHLLQSLNISRGQQYLETFSTSTTHNELKQYANLLEKHHNKTNNENCQTIYQYLEIPNAHHFHSLTSVFLTNKGEPRSIKPTQARKKSMGEANEVEFLRLNTKLTTSVIATLELSYRLLTFDLSSAWYKAGTAYIEQYQLLKRQQRLLDFTDLEWKAYTLLNDRNNTEWVQQKLDQRINHILVDEFQDTNPTQWQLLSPLLSEIIAGDPNRLRSIFLVGDTKQSIYRFRRANADLFPNATSWLSQIAQTNEITLSQSWRSSPTIMNFVNNVFELPSLKQRLPTFSHHETFRKTLYGKVDVLPLIETEPTETTLHSDELRNPMRQPRVLEKDLRHYREGQQIAQTITQLIERPDNAVNTFNDIIILVRNRTHVSDFEQALTEADIPYNNLSQASILDHLEIQDIVHLLQIILAPFNNHTLACVLKSPLFHCSDHDLMSLAKHRLNEVPHPNWFQSLQAISKSNSNGTALEQAHYWLTHWQNIARLLPIHDLLDKIYHQRQVIQRYTHAFPPQKRNQVTSNLTYFIELALEVDSGRYPSLGHFLDKISSLHQHKENSLLLPNAIQDSSSVRLMTIHAAKGLESTVVFLADTTNTQTGTYTHKPIIQWPASSRRPTDFFLAGKSQDGLTKNHIKRLKEEEADENARLLYVALTRAKQYLFISGCAEKKSTNSCWYHLLSEAHVPETNTIPERNEGPRKHTAPKKLYTALPPELTEIKPHPAHQKHTQATNHQPPEKAAILKGKVIHRLLERLSENKHTEIDVKKSVTQEFNLTKHYLEEAGWWNEALSVIHNKALSPIFRPMHYISAFNEVPISYPQNKLIIHGIIDRLVIYKSEVLIIDYKTRSISASADMPSIMKSHKEQMNRYREGITALYPHKTVRAALLFTTNQMLQEYEEEP